MENINYFCYIERAQEKALWMYKIWDNKNGNNDT